MRVLGIDFGSKRVGIAISDEGGRLAFPKEILGNDKNLIDNVNRIFEDTKSELIVVGSSYDENNKPNDIMKNIEHFTEALQEKTKAKVEREAEFFTSMEARRFQPERKAIDDSAAALILQRYLDRRNKYKV